MSTITKISMIRFAQSFHLYIHAYALILLNRGLSLVQITSIESIVIGTIFVMEMPTGVIADRIGRKWSITLALFLMMCAEFLFLIAQGYVVYIVVAILTGTGFAFASGAIEAMLYDSLPEDDRENRMKRAMGQVKSSARIAFFLSPIIGALIIGNMSDDRYLIAIALTVFALLIGVLISLSLEEPQSEWEAERPDSIAILKAGVAELRGNRRLLGLVAIVIFTTPFTSTLIVNLGAPYLADNGVSQFAIGMSLSLGNLLSAFTNRYAYKFEEWLGAGRALFVLLLLPGLLYFVLAMVSGSIVPVLIIILMYGTADMKDPLISAYQNAMIDSKHRATVLSIINMFLNLFVAVLAPVYAFVGTMSLSLAFVIMGTVIILATLFSGVLRFKQASTRVI